MKIKFTTCIFFSAIIFVHAQTPDWRWAKSMGGSGSDTGYAVTADAAGNSYTTGHFLNTVDFDPGAGISNFTAAGGSDIFILKLDISGNFVWAKQISGADDEKGYSIALDASGNIFVTGSFEGTVDFDPGAANFNLMSSGDNDIFILKLDNSGNFIWAGNIGSTYLDVGYGIAIDQTTGNVYVSGAFSGSVDFDPGSGSTGLGSSGGKDAFVLKLDNAGNFIWARGLGSPTGQDFSYAIAFDPSGNGSIYSTGIFHGPADFDPSVGGFYITSYGIDGDVFISKLDTAGIFVWAKAFSGSGSFYDNSFGLSMKVDANSNIYTTGNFEGTVDFDPGTGVYNLTSPGTDYFISKLNSNGDFLWAKASDEGSAWGKSITVISDGNGQVYVTGYFENTVDFDPGAAVFDLTAVSQSIFLSKLDGDGNFVWAKAPDGSGDDVPCSITNTLSGNILLTGSFFSPEIPFAATTLLNADTLGLTSDIFVARIDSATGVGIEDLTHSDAGIFIFPNPNNGTFSIMNPVNKECEFFIYNTIGEKIFSGSLNGTQTEIKVTNVPGIYYLSIRSESFRYTLKLIVE
jgi:hypothetical protein